MSMFTEMNPRQRLVYHVQELERLEEVKALAVADLREGFQRAKAEGYDAATLKVVLKLRKMTPSQRSERRALEAIYMAALGMLEGEPLPEEARRRLDRQLEPASPLEPAADTKSDDRAPVPDLSRPAHQPALVLKDPSEARQEGCDAAVAGKRIYDNPYAAGDPCRAAWDEGWCVQSKSHGMETPAAYQRRATKPPAPDKKDDSDGHAGAADKKDAA